MPTLPIDALRDYMAAILGAAGAPDDIAAEVAAVLADNHLAGHDSHGILRVPEYVHAVDIGEVVPTARPHVVTDTPVTALVSGNGAFGQTAANLAVDVVTDKAREHGVAAVSLIRTGHTGRLAAFTERGARRGVAIFMAIGTVHSPVMVPHGGREPMFGTNPIAFSLPGEGEHPITVDYATSMIAAGKVKVAHAAGERVPPGAIVDAAGRPTTDPADFLEGGALQPFGGHKGYGLAVVAEVLGYAVTGSDEHTQDGGGSGVFLFAIAADAFRDREGYDRAVAAIAARIRAVPPAEGFDEVLLPGDPEARQRAQRERDGIRVADTTWQQVAELAHVLGVRVPEVAST